MATYTVHYTLRNGSSSVNGSKSVTCETERTAVESARDQALATRPDWSFSATRVDKKH